MPNAALIDLSNIQRATDDETTATRDNDAGPKDPRVYAKLRQRLAVARGKLPPLYRDAVYDPFVGTLDRLGAAGFKGTLARDPENEGTGRMMLDIAQAILQQ